MVRPFRLVMSGVKLFLITLGILTLASMIIQQTGDQKLGVIVGLIVAVGVFYHYRSLDNAKGYAINFNGYVVPTTEDYYFLLDKNQPVYEGLMLVAKLPYQMLFRGKTIFVVFPKGKGPQ